MSAQNTGHTIKTLVPRPVRTLITGGSLCLLLGFGNTTYGSFKLKEYEFLLSKAASELATPYPAHPELPFKLEVNTDKQVLYINKLKSRISFYSFVVLGGKSILALSGILFLGALLWWRTTGEGGGAEEHTEHPPS